MTWGSPTSSSPTAQGMKKRHDTGLGLSESPPPSMKQQQTTTSPTASTSTHSSPQSGSTTPPVQSRFHESLLMRDTIPDPNAHAKHIYYRRRLHQEIFRDVHLDWRSAPVVCDEQYDFASLLYRPQLRCHASRQYLLEVQSELRRKASEAVGRDVESKHVAAPYVVYIDGEEMIDMIG